MLRNVNKIYLPAIALILLSGCDILMSDNPGIEYDRGTVVYVNLEGGFWGIISESNQAYDVLNLPEEFKQDSLHVEFLYKYSDSQVSFHMWGKIIEIIEINKI